MQTRLRSALEAASNSAFGYVVSLGVAAVVFPLAGFETSTGKSASVVLVFHAVSALRSYLLRRGFELWDRRRPGRRG